MDEKRVVIFPSIIRRKNKIYTNSSRKISKLVDTDLGELESLKEINK